MSGILLSCANWPIIREIAILLGWIMNIIYTIFDAIGIANIGLCIIVFTIIVRLCMIPMSIKQQKTMKLTALMNPEIQAIQKKYAGRRDNDSMMAMNAETKAVYEKYGTSPSGGCLPLLIQMPILLALYGVISSIPTHVAPIGDMYTQVATEIYESSQFYDELNQLNDLMIEYGIEGFEKDAQYTVLVNAYCGSNASVSSVKKLLTDYTTRSSARLSTLTSDAWAEAKTMKDAAIKIVKKLENVSQDDWNKVIDEYAKKDGASDITLNIIKDYSDGTIEYTENDKKKEITYDGLVVLFNENYEVVDEIHSEVVGIYSFAGINLSSSPSNEMAVGIWWAILIPVLSAVLQWASMSHSTKTQQTSLEDNPMASSMKMMNVFMPLMSAFFCYSFESGLGLYWVMGSLFQLVQQIILSGYFKKLTPDDIVKSNIAKINKKRAKKGLPPQKITSVANTSVKNIKVEPKKVNTAKTTSGVTYKQGGIAAKAHMVKEYNDKKTK